MKNEVRIKVIGSTATGKSRLIFLIKDMLKRYDFETELIQYDYVDEAEFDHDISKHIVPAITAIKDKTKIIIEEVQTPRPIN
jgi:Ni2+-binding GTPase involved in maturation of urease and hydrogenase